VDIRRFGPGYRRAEGPPGTQGVAGQVILHDDRAVVSELAFSRYAMITPHANAASTALFIVISGAGFVQVGDDRERVNHGEAVLWPAGVLHGAYTDGTEMRAIIVELPGDDDGQVVVEAEADTPAGQPQPVDESSPASPAEGELAERTPLRDEYDASEGEPW